MNGIFMGYEWDIDDLPSRNVRHRHEKWMTMAYGVAYGVPCFTWFTYQMVIFHT